MQGFNMANVTENENDEFYGISFSQVETDDDGNTQIRDVKPVTYALMSWWKGNGNPDTIDISEDSNYSTLEIQTDLEGIKDGAAALTIYLEANEVQSSLCCYIYSSAFAGIDEKAFEGYLNQSIMEYNQTAICGSLETVPSNIEGKFNLRFKSSVWMEDIPTGKVEMVRGLVSRSFEEIRNAIQLIFPEFVEA